MQFNRLNGADINLPEWIFSKMMRSAQIRYSDHCILRVIQILGKLGNWRRVLQVIEWLQMRERFKSYRLRYSFYLLFFWWTECMFDCSILHLHNGTKICINKAVLTSHCCWKKSITSLSTIFITINFTHLIDWMPQEWSFCHRGRILKNVIGKLC